MRAFLKPHDIGSWNICYKTQEAGVVWKIHHIECASRPALHSSVMSFTIISRRMRFNCECRSHKGRFRENLIRRCMTKTDSRCLIRDLRKDLLAYGHVGDLDRSCHHWTGTDITTNMYVRAGSSGKLIPLTCMPRSIAWTHKRSKMRLSPAVHHYVQAEAWTLAGAHAETLVDGP